MDDLLQHVSFAGLDEKGGPLFDLSICYPDPVEGDPPASRRQIENVIQKYGDIFSELTNQQADALLSAGSFGHYYSRQRTIRTRTPVKNLIATVIAVMVLSSDDLTEQALWWSHDNFAEERDPNIYQFAGFDLIDQAVSSLLQSNPDLQSIIRFD